MPRNWKKPIATYEKHDGPSSPHGGEDSAIHQNGGGGAKTKKETKSIYLTSSERTHLLTYLKDYRDRAKTIFSSGSENGPATTATAVAATISNRSGKARRSSSDILIGETTLPALTREILIHPYLALPKTLTSKQRRCVHELCTNLDLYHCSVGPSRDDRFVAISIHSDGFNYLPEVPTRTGSLVPLARCRPWYFRTTNPEEETKIGLKPVYELFDQPSQCLRDGVDVLNFSNLENQSLATIPSPSHDDNWMLVDSADKMKQCAQELFDADPTEIGFDMEMYNPSKYVQVTCLLQLVSSAGKEYVVDTFAPGVWDLVSLLAPLFADYNIVKIGHCIGGMDIKSLHLDFGIFVVNAFDTFEAATVLRLQGKGLATVCESYGLTDSETYAQLKADHQRMDWRKRPLSESMIRYGRSDVHYLIQLRMLMMRDLTRRELWDVDQEAQHTESRMVASSVQSMQSMWRQYEDDEDDDRDESNRIDSNEDDGYITAPEDKDEKEEPALQTEFEAGDLRLQVDLMTVLSKSQQSCLRVWARKEESPYRSDPFLSVSARARRGETEWEESHLKLYNELVHWRTTVANEVGAHPGLICPLDLLVRIAEKRPTSEASLRRISFHLPDLLEETYNGHMSVILSMATASLERDGLDPNSKTVQQYKVPALEATTIIGKLEATNSTQEKKKGRMLATAIAFGTIAVAVAVMVTRRKSI